MNESSLLDLAGIIVIGIGAQWVASRFRLPSILLLLIFGFLAGLVTGFLNPDTSMGNLLSPFIALSLALILFEGGMNLKISDALVEWKGRSQPSFYRRRHDMDHHFDFRIYRFGLDPFLSILIGSIMNVTGLTVVIPSLLYVRPSGKAGPFFKWEGIMNDSIGAILSVLYNDFFYDCVVCDHRL